MAPMRPTPVRSSSTSPAAQISLAGSRYMPSSAATTSFPMRPCLTASAGKMPLSYANCSWMFVGPSPVSDGCGGTNTVRPKSATFSAYRPSSRLTRMFSVFKSRWNRLRPCRNSSASHSCLKMCATTGSRIGSSGCVLTYPNRSPPSHKSQAK